MSLFSHIPQEPEDPIYGLQLQYKADERHNKINLSIGILVGDNGRLLEFPTVAHAEALILEKHFGKEYLPIDGLHSFTTGMHKLVLPEASAYVAQAIGGTGALYIASRFCKQYITKKIYLPDPAWVNHPKILKNAGLEVISLPYTIVNGVLDITSFLEAIEKCEEKSAILLQASCHNPTGVDPKDDHWKEIAKIVKKKNLFTIFDLAYQGLGRGFEEDVLSLRAFFEEGCEFFVATSCSKNFSLYNERLGALLAVTQQKNIARVASAVRRLIRATYSSPPAHSAYVASTILNDKDLKKMWQTEVSLARMNLQRRRKELVDAMKKLNPKANVLPIKESVGLFAKTGLSYEQIISLRKLEALYMNDDSRINIAALPEKEIQHIANLVIYET